MSSQRPHILPIPPLKVPQQIGQRLSAKLVLEKAAANVRDPFLVERPSHSMLYTIYTIFTRGRDVINK